MENSQEFPAEYLRKTYRQLKKRRQKEMQEQKKTKKLLTDKRFKKMEQQVFSIKVLMENSFSPPIKNYSSFEEITLIGEFNEFIENNELNISKALFKHLSELLNDDTGYMNCLGNIVTTKLIEIVGIQDVVELSNIEPDYIEVYRFFYSFERNISKKEFLKLYYFDDLDLME